MRIEPMRFSRWQMVLICWRIAWDELRAGGIRYALVVFVAAPFIARPLTVEFTLGGTVAK